MENNNNNNNVVETEVKKKKGIGFYLPLTIVILIVLGGAYYWYREYTKYITTDDAYVDSDNVSLSPTNRFQSNFQLSVERAKAVAALVQPQLSQPGRLVVAGKGPDNPIAPNSTAEGRAKNRRVEVLVTRTD